MDPSCRAGGVLAACLIPQLWKLGRTRSAADISLPFLLIYLLGLVVSFVYLYYEDAVVAWACLLVEIGVRTSGAGTLGCHTLRPAVWSCFGWGLLGCLACAAPVSPSPASPCRLRAADGVGKALPGSMGPLQPTRAAPPPPGGRAHQQPLLCRHSGVGWGAGLPARRAVAGDSARDPVLGQLLDWAELTPGQGHCECGS